MQTQLANCVKHSDYFPMSNDHNTQPKNDRSCRTLPLDARVVVASRNTTLSVLRMNQHPLLLTSTCSSSFLPYHAYCLVAIANS
eukprot:c43432_g1_i1 orf=59-310(+)